MLVDFHEKPAGDSTCTLECNHQLDQGTGLGKGGGVRRGSCPECSVEMGEEVHKMTACPPSILY